MFISERLNPRAPPENVSNIPNIPDIPHIPHIPDISHICLIPLIFLISLNLSLIFRIFHLIEHIDYLKLNEILLECKRVLSPNGLIIMQTPSIDNILVATKLAFSSPTKIFA